MFLREILVLAVVLPLAAACASESDSESNQLGLVGTQATASTPTVSARGSCDPSYPSVCIPPAPPDLDCGQIEFRRFEVVAPDPHGFDLDFDGIGCETD
jgi:micrococcal nuclease